MERHEAIVAGAGPAGLAAAAMLRKHGFETLVLESTEAVGARWRTRYDGLRLNTMRTFSTMPGLRMGLKAGLYPSRDDFVAYLERYAAHHELPIRFGTSLERVDHVDDGDWALTTSGGEVRARYVVVATGYDAVRIMPEWTERADRSRATSSTPAECGRSSPTAAGRADGRGRQHRASTWRGTSSRPGADVTVAMRTPPNLFRRDLFGFAATSRWRSCSTGCPRSSATGSGSWRSG